MNMLLLINRGFRSKVNNDNLLEKVKEAGFEKLDDFVKANLHYLPNEKQKLFYSVIDIVKELGYATTPRKPYYKTNY
jgi:hypothetical protein